MIDLPKELIIDNIAFPIDSDFRNIININIMLNDDELDKEEKAYLLLDNLYDCDVNELPDLQEALDKAVWFIDWGKDYKKDNENNDKPKLLDWQKDFNYVCSAVNCKVGVMDIRELPYMHWWTFLGYFAERGKCHLSTIMEVREKLAKHQKLEKWEAEFYKENKEEIDIDYYEEDDDDFWGGE